MPTHARRPQAPRPPIWFGGWAHGDIAEMGLLLAQAVPSVPPSVTLVAGLDLTGGVVSYRWPAGGA